MSKHSSRLTWIKRNEISRKTANHLYCSIKNYLSIWSGMLENYGENVIVGIWLLQSLRAHTHFLLFVGVRCKWQTPFILTELKWKLYFQFLIQIALLCVHIECLQCNERLNEGFRDKLNLYGFVRFVKNAIDSNSLEAEYVSLSLSLSA